MKKFIAFTERYILSESFFASSLANDLESFRNFRLYDTVEEFTANERKLLLERHSPTTNGTVVLYEINLMEDSGIHLSLVQTHTYRVAKTSLYHVLSESEITLYRNGKLNTIIPALRKKACPNLIEATDKSFTQLNRIGLLVLEFIEHLYVNGVEQVRPSFYNWSVNDKFVTDDGIYSIQDSPLLFVVTETIPLKDVK